MKKLFHGAYLVIITAGLTICFASCLQTKKIPKGAVFYKLIKNGNDDSLKKYTVKKAFEADISNEKKYLILDVPQKIIDDPAYLHPPTMSTISVGVLGTDAQLLISQDYFYKNTKFDTDLKKRKKFVYYDSKPTLQSLTIPLKIRPALTGGTYGNAFPKQVEGDFNFGFAGVWKFNKNTFRSEPNVLGSTNNQLSIAPGLLLNLNSTSLNKDNTRPSFSVERNAFSYSLGVVLMVGFNNFNFGVARGCDYVTREGKADWVYQGKPWTGIIFALDLFK